MSKESEPAKVAEVLTKVLEVTSSDEEFLEATITLKGMRRGRLKRKLIVKMSSSKLQWN